MERTPQLPTPPDLNDFETQKGLRQSAMRMYNYLIESRRKLQNLFGQVASDLNYMYGEAAFSGAPATTTLTIPGAVPGFPVTATFDQDLAGNTLSAYVSAPDTVKVLMSGSSSLSAGKIRVWCQPRTLP